MRPRARESVGAGRRQIAAARRKDSVRAKAVIEVSATGKAALTAYEFRERSSLAYVNPPTVGELIATIMTISSSGRRFQICEHVAATHHPQWVRTFARWR
jgi:hypothetical protein